MSKFYLTAGCAIALTLAGCAASTQLGYDEWTRTTAYPAQYARGEVGYKITCEGSTATCLQRAQAMCPGPYRLIGSPHKSPRLQALLPSQNLTVLNTDNPQLIYIACE